MLTSNSKRSPSIETIDGSIVYGKLNKAESNPLDWAQSLSTNEPEKKVFWSEYESVQDYLIALGFQYIDAFQHFASNDKIVSVEEMLIHNSPELMAKYLGRLEG